MFNLKRCRGRAVAPFVVFAVLCFVLMVNRGFAQVTDKVTHPAPDYGTYLPPKAGGTFKDPIFLSTVKRISDATLLRNDATSAGSVPFVTGEYSTVSPFNQDNSRFLLLHASYYGLYDAKGKFIRNLPFDVSGGSEPRWSRASANVLYYHSGNQLKRLDTSNNKITVLHTFTEYSSITGAGESDICFDGDHMIFAGNGRYVFVYELSTEKKGAVLDTGGQPFDSLYLTPDDHVTITWGSITAAHGGIELFDRNMTFLRRVAPVPGHMDVTRDTNGDEVLLWFNAADPHPVCENGVVKIRLADAMQTCLVTFDWSLAVHVSAADQGGWFFVETYAPEDPKTDADWKPYTNEVLQVKMDGAAVRRIAHHRSKPFDSYNYTPRVTTSRDGSRVIFTSNFGMKSIIETTVSNAANVPLATGSLLRTILSSLNPGSIASFLTALGANATTLAGYISAEYTDAYLVELDPATTGTAIAGVVDPPGTDDGPPVQDTPPQSPLVPTVVLTPGHYEQDDAAIAYAGDWLLNKLSLHKGGTASLSTTPGSRAALLFTGTGISVTGFRDEWSGLARIYIDGDAVGTIDAYRAPARAQTVLYSAQGLVNGTHTFSVEIMGTRDNRSAGAWIWLDAFDITGAAPPGTSAGIGDVATTREDFVVSKDGAAAWRGTGGTELKNVYGRVALTDGEKAFSGLAIFSNQVDGVRVSELSVQASPLLRAGRIFANVDRTGNTGVAIVNPQDTPVHVAYALIDSQGQEGTQGFLILRPHEKVSRFVNESPFFSDSTFEGSLTLTASQSIAVTAFDSLVNERGEFLMGDAGVLDIERSSDIPPVLAHFANGGGWETQVLLLNSADEPINGLLTFFDDSGARLNFVLPYSVPPRAGVRVPIPFDFWVSTGSAVVVPDLNTAMPWASSHMTYKPGNVTVNKVSMSSVLASGFRAYVEVGAGMESAIAVVNSSNSASKVNLVLTTPDGIVVRTRTLDLSGRARVAQMLTTYFPGLPPSFTGVLHLMATTADGISVAIFRCRYNERGDFMATSTVPIADQSSPTSDLFFPHIVGGQGYSTELVLFNGDVSPLEGTLQLFDPTGTAVPTGEVIAPNKGDNL